MRQFIFDTFCLGASIAQFKPPMEMEQTTYGRLTIYSDVMGVDIYADATISNIPAGKHYVRVVKGFNS